MAVEAAPAAKQSLESISALAEIERARSGENVRSVKLVAQKFLGHIYNKDTKKIEAMAVQSLKDDDVVLDYSESLYVATLDATTDTAVNHLNNCFGFNIVGAIGATSLKAEAGLDISHDKVASSNSSTVFCAVACVRKDHVGFQGQPKRLGVESESFHSGIIKSMTVYAGYRVVLEIVFNNNKSEQKMNVGVKGGGSALSTAIGGNIQFVHESTSLADRNIEQINIKEIRAIGGFRVPKMEIPKGDDFPKIQEMFEDIREHFETHYYSIVDRLTCIQENDLIPLRESSSSKVGEDIKIPSGNMIPVKPSTTERDATYYERLAEELRYYQESYYYKSGKEDKPLNLAAMLQAIEISFSNLSESSNLKPSFLLVGTDPLTTRMQAVRIMGGRVHKGKALYPNHQSESVTKFHLPGKSLPSIFPSDNFSEESSLLGVYVYNGILETPILTDASMPLEFDICLGVATSCAISRFTPSKVIFCLPQDFFNPYSSISLVEKMNRLYDSLRRIFYDPTFCKKSILFVIDDQEEGYQYLQKEIPGAFEYLKKELENRGGGIFSWSTISSILGFGTVKKVGEAEDALFIYEFIINRLIRSSNLNDVLSSKEETFSFHPEFEATSKSESKKKSKPTDKQKLEALPPHEFDMYNMTLYNFRVVEKVFSDTLYHLKTVDDAIVYGENESSTISKVLKSYDRVLTLLKKRELEKLEKKDADEILGKAIAEEIDKWRVQKEKAENEIKKNNESIKTKESDIIRLKKDETPTPLTLQPSEAITMRPIWRVPPFGKEYTFQTSHEFSKCEFDKTPGAFNCPEAEFMNTKKVIFTPKHWGHKEDLKAKVQIWIKNNEHPETIKTIETLEREIKYLKNANISLQTNLKAASEALVNVSESNIENLESTLNEKKAVFVDYQSKLDAMRFRFAPYREYYEMLAKVKIEYSLEQKYEEVSDACAIS